jgi:SAM-dependent methyltransferase
MEFDHKEYPKQVGEKDYWAQVKRTVNGQPVSEADIAMITTAIRQGLQLQVGGKDTLLDLGCGNGALTARFYDSLQAALGVDFSDYLIGIAQRDFQLTGRFEYQVGDAHDFLQTTPRGDEFNKVLMYGCFAYFPDAQGTLTRLRERCPNVTRVFIGNMPDLALAELFYYKGLPEATELRDFDSKIGIWRTEAEFRALAKAAGWQAEFPRMPAAFYAAHYRYDVVLTPA